MVDNNNYVCGIYFFILCIILKTLFSFLFALRSTLWRSQTPLILDEFLEFFSCKSWSIWPSSYSGMCHQCDMRYSLAILLASAFSPFHALQFTLIIGSSSLSMRLQSFEANFSPASRPSLRVAVSSGARNASRFWLILCLHANGKIVWYPRQEILELLIAHQCWQGGLINMYNPVALRRKAQSDNKQGVRINYDLRTPSFVDDDSLLTDFCFTIHGFTFWNFRTQPSLGCFGNEAFNQVTDSAPQSEAELVGWQC